jgi:hypothetical protein
MMNLAQTARKFFGIYRDGFREMKPLGKKLWLIIGIKFVIFFLIMKLLFFPDFLQTNFTNDADRADYVMNNLIEGEK